MKKAICMYCGKETDKIKIFPMGKKTAFYDCEECGIDVELLWNDRLEKLYGRFKQKKLGM